MFVDSRKIATGTTVSTDICIIGAGPAGITIAREFVNCSMQVVLLESGDTSVREESQSLCRGTSTGQLYPPLHLCRRRVFGGSSTHWGGWARPLDTIDFQKRDWVPYSGWPFSKAELEPWYADASKVWKLDACSYEPNCFESETDLLGDDHSGFRNIVFRVAVTRFGKTYRAELEQARNIDVMLHANALEIETDREGRAAISVRIATLAGNQFTIKARKFVLAAGGIENPRLLLSSRKWQSCGIGNENDLVGRFFADHLHFELRRVPLNGRPIPKFYRVQLHGGAGLRGGMALTEDSRRERKLLGFAITMHNPDNPHDVLYPHYSNLGYSSLQAIARPLIDGELPDLLGYHLRLIFLHPANTFSLLVRKMITTRWHAFVVGCRAEQSPNPTSRVMLDTEKDAFGVNRARLNWHLTKQDLESARRAAELLQSHWQFPTHGVALSRAELMPEISAASHHMGTTRMHRDPKFGVVDDNCRVHGMRNLYVAGTSVFPTTGWAPPTLTTIALALRLSHFLKQSRE